MSRVILTVCLALLTLTGVAQTKGVSAADVDSVATKVYMDYEGKLNSIVEQFAKVDSASQVALAAEYTDLSKRCNVGVFKIYASHANDGEYYIEMMYRLRSGVDKGLLSAAYGKIKGKIRAESPYAASLKKHLDMEQVVAGGTAFDFSATMTSGEEFKLSEFLGLKDVLLIFGPQWIDQSTMAILSMLYGKSDLGKMEVVGVSVTATDLESLRAEVADNGNASWTNVSDFKGDHSDAKIAYGVQALPVFVLVRMGGTVEFVSVGAAQQVFAAFAKQ